MNEYILSLPTLTTFASASSPSEDLNTHKKKIEKVESLGWKRRRRKGRCGLTNDEERGFQDTETQDSEADTVSLRNRGKSHARQGTALLSHWSAQEPAAGTLAFQNRQAEVMRM